MKTVIFLASLILCSSALADTIYVYKDKGGAVRFTNRPPPAGIEAKVFRPGQARFSLMAGFKSREDPLFRTAFRPIIEREAAASRVDPDLVRAVIHVESGFNPRAVSPKGALGLMQLMPETAAALGVRNTFHPSSNIAAGVKHLANLLQKYRGQLRLALAAYNAGEGAVERYSGIPPYQETEQYVERVVGLYKRYSSG